MRDASIDRGGRLHLQNRFLVFLAVATSSLVLSNAAAAQKVTVDADPAHVANTFSPVRSLGAAIDRLRTGTPDHLLKDPLLHEILGAGWQTVTYRQNTELMVEAWHWNPAGQVEQRRQAGRLLRRQRRARRGNSQFVGLPAAASRLQSRRRQRLVAPHRRRSQVVLEEQSVPDQGLHRRRRLAASAVGDDRPRQQDRRQRHSDRMGRSLREALRSAILDRRTRALLRRHDQGHVADISAGHHHRRQGRHGHAETGFLDDSRPLPPHLDDRIFQHLRHSRLRRQAQLRGICHQRTLRRSALGRRRVQRLRHAFSQPRSDRHVAVVGRSLDRVYRSRPISRRSGRIRFLLHLRRHARTSDDGPDRDALRHARGCGERDRLSLQAPLSHLLRRDGRRGRRPAHAPRRLRRVVPTVRDRDSQTRARSEARRPALRRNIRRRRSLARCQRKSFLDRPLRRLPESARPPERLHVLFFRTLSVSGSSHLFLGRSLSRAGIRQPHRASLERQRPAVEYSVLHDRGQHRRRRAAIDREERPVARRLRRHHDERGRGRDLLFPLHAVPARTWAASGISCGSTRTTR